MAETTEKPPVKQSPEQMDSVPIHADDAQSSNPIPPLMTGALEALASLSRDLAAMAKAVSTREIELRKLLDLMQTVDHGVLPEDVLGNIFESFRGVIPFERIGCAFLAEDSKRVVAYWAKSELGPIHIRKNYSQPLAGSSLEGILATGQPRIINDLEEYLAGKPDLSVGSGGPPARFSILYKRPEERVQGHPSIHFSADRQPGCIGHGEEPPVSEAAGTKPVFSPEERKSSDCSRA